MNKRNVRSWTLGGLALVLLGTPLLAGCTSGASVGALRTESQSVELELSGGAEKLLSGP